MALPPLVTVDDLSDWLGQPIEEDDPRAGAVLRAASTLVRRETGRDWVLEGEEDPTLDESEPTIDEDDLEVAQTVVKQVATRVWANPTGVVHETTGPFSARYSEDVAQGLFLTDTEKEMLAAYKTTSRPSLWTLATTRLASPGVTDMGLLADNGTIYVEVEPTGDPLPYIDSGEFL